MLIDIPYDAHHSQGLDVPDLDIRQVGRAHLLQTPLKAQSLNLVKNWIKLLTKLVCGFSSAWLQLYELPDEDVHVENLGLLVGMEAEPRAVRTATRVHLILI
jgi:hypothetical protein